MSLSSQSPPKSSLGSYLKNDRAGLATSGRALDLPPINYNDPNGYYEELGLEPTATQRQIKDAYRRLSRVYHPDGTNPDPEKFMYVQHIYNVLLDPDSKWDYDHTEGTYLSHWEIAELRLENPDLLDQLDKLDEEPDNEVLEMLEEIVDSLRKSLEHYTFYGDVEFEDTAQRWVWCFLEALWADNREALVRVGVRQQEDALVVRKTPGLVVYFFRPDIEPHPLIAYWALHNL